MMRFLAMGTIGLLCALLPCSNALSDIDNPYKNINNNTTFWAKGQVHCHSERSDGSKLCHYVASQYYDHGYTFFCLTDHSDGANEEGETPVYHELPLGEILYDCTFYKDINDRDIKRIPILYIPSIEADDSAGIGGCGKIYSDRHFLGLNITTKKIHDVCCPGKIAKCFKSSQDQINATINQGGIAVLAHPKDKKSSWNVFDIIKYKNYHGMQFNGHHDDKLEPTIKSWDAILYTGRKVWIFGGDDWHGGDGSFDRGYIMVNLPIPPQDYLCREGWQKDSNCGINEDVLRERIVDNIKIGNFYSVYCKENGIDRNPSHDPPDFEKIEVLNGDTIQVETSKSCTFTFVAGLRDPIDVAEEYYETTAKYYFPNQVLQIVGEYFPSDFCNNFTCGATISTLPRVIRGIRSHYRYEMTEEEIAAKIKEINERVTGISFEKIAEAKTERFVLPKTGTSTSVTFPLLDYLKYPSLYRYVRIEAKDDYGNILYSQPIYIEGIMLPNVDKLDIYAEGKLLAKERIIVGQHLVIYGDLQTDSNNKSIVETDNFGLRKLYADESTEVMLFERGTAQLKDGEVTVHLDPMFLEMVAIDDDNPVLIKITLTSDCKGIYVSKKTDSGFTIKEIEGGTSSATFNWEAAAKRRGYEEIRLKEPSAE